MNFLTNCCVGDAEAEDMDVVGKEEDVGKVVMVGTGFFIIINF